MNNFHLILALFLVSVSVSAQMHPERGGQLVSIMGGFHADTTIEQFRARCRELRGRVQVERPRGEGTTLVKCRNSPLTVHEDVDPNARALPSLVYVPYATFHPDGQNEAVGIILTEVTNVSGRASRTAREIRFTEAIHTIRQTILRSLENVQRLIQPEAVCSTSRWRLPPTAGHEFYPSAELRRQYYETIGCLEQRPGERAFEGFEAGDEYVRLVLSNSQTQVDGQFYNGIHVNLIWSRRH